MQHNIGGGAQKVGVACLCVCAGADVEEPTEEGGAVLMCVSELPNKEEKKKEKAITIGFLVRRKTILVSRGQPCYLRSFSRREQGETKTALIRTPEMWPSLILSFL